MHSKQRKEYVAKSNSNERKLQQKEFNINEK